MLFAPGRNDKTSLWQQGKAAKRNGQLLLGRRGAVGIASPILSNAPPGTQELEITAKANTKLVRYVLLVGAGLQGQGPRDWG